MKYLCFLLISTISQAQMPEHVKAFIDKYEPLAQEVFEIYGVPKAVTLAIASYETGFGRSHNAKERNNFFGMKAWGSRCEGEKWCWRTYEDPKESFYDFGSLLMTTQRYKSLRTLHKKDYKTWCKMISECGYNRSETYPGNLVSIIERWGFAK